MGNVFDNAMMCNPTQPSQLMALSPVDLKITCRSKAVRDGLAQVLNALAPLDLDTEERSTVELVLAEVLNNIVEHAYGPAGIGPISVCADHRADGLHFRINDFGRAMPDGQTPVIQTNNFEVGLHDLPEGGFGWLLIRQLATNVTYRRIGNENRLELHLAVATARTN